MSPHANDDIAPSGTRQVLVVDDEPGSLYILDTFLQGIGFKVTLATDGAEALQSFTNGRFDMVVTDFQMPVMDGLTLIARIRALLPAIPVILISGCSLEEICPDGERPDGVTFIAKPFTLGDFRRQVLRLCMKANRQASAGPAEV